MPRSLYPGGRLTLRSPGSLVTLPAPMHRTLEMAAPRAEGWRTRLRPEHLIMGGTMLALVVLVVLPLASLVWGSVRGTDGVTLEHFRQAFTNRLYYQAVRNSLVLGLWTALFSVLIGLPMAWAVSRSDVPAKGFIRFTANISYLTPPFLTAIAFVNLASPNAGILNRLARDVLGMPELTFNVFSMSGLVLVTVLHTFPYVYMLASSALESVDASLEESARMLGAGTLRTALSITAPLVAPAVLAGALLAS
jgi:iron(III) transport system permease protein